LSDRKLSTEIDRLLKPGQKTDRRSTQQGHVSSAIRDRIMSKCGYGVEDIPETVSGYGASSAEEWFAEALSEGLCSSNPRPVAKELLKWVEDAMGEV
jgi:hypothetical protein